MSLIPGAEGYACPVVTCTWGPTIVLLKIQSTKQWNVSGLPGLFDASVLAANLATASVGGGRSFTSLCSSCTLQAIFIRNLLTVKKNTEVTNSEL